MQRLYRSREDKMLGGVCSGIASYFNIDPVIIRLIFIFFLFIEGSGLLAYLVAWVIIPMEPEKPGDVTIEIESEGEDTNKKENKNNNNHNINNENDYNSTNSNNDKDNKEAENSNKTEKQGDETKSN